MPSVAELLQTLHPMREPPPPAPVAPYLAALAVGIAGAAVLLLLLRRARRQRRALRLAAETALAASRRLSPPERLAAQAQLLRGLVRAQLGDTAARLQGAAWLGTLDRLFGTTFFTQGEGRAYGDALYRRGSDGVAEALDGALARLIRQARFAGPQP